MIPRFQPATYLLVCGPPLDAWALHARAPPSILHNLVAAVRVNLRAISVARHVSGPL